jgi:hypothetical protein
MPRKAHLPVIAALLVTPSLAPAYFGFGHQAIGDIAFTRLTPKAKNEIRKMLTAGDKRFRPGNNSDAALGRSFREMTTWADLIKGDRASVYEPMIVQANRTFIPFSDPNDTEQQACRSWHYYDTPIRASGTTPPVPLSNALSAMSLVSQNLRSEKNPFRRCFWLYWAGHLVGDLHQPLHCVNDFKYRRNGDRGGNDFEIDLVNSFNGRNYNLHAYWDASIEDAAKAEGLTDFFAHPPLGAGLKCSSQAD